MLLSFSESDGGGLSFYAGILRLQTQIVEGTVVELAEPIKIEMRDFITAYESLPLAPKNIGVPGSFDDAVDRIKRVFGV